MNEKLERCPFCGGEAELHLVPYNYYIDCKVCGAETSWWDTKEEAIEAWNNRSERMAKVSNQIFNNSNSYTVGTWIGTCECGELVSYSSKYCHMCGARLEWNHE